MAAPPPRLALSSCPRRPSFPLTFSCLRPHPSSCLPDDLHLPSPPSGSPPPPRSFSLVLKALQQPSLNRAVHQLSAVTQLLLPDVPSTLLNEIKKRMGAFPLQVDEATESENDRAQNAVVPPLPGAEGVELLELWDDHESHHSSWTMDKTSSVEQQRFNKVPELSMANTHEESPHVETSMNQYKALTRRDADLSLGETVLFPRCSWPRDEVKSVRLDISNLQSSPVHTNLAESTDSVSGPVTLREKSTRYYPEEVEEMGRARCAWPRSVPCNTPQAPHQCLGRELQSNMMNNISSISRQPSSTSETEISDGNAILGTSTVSFVPEIQINHSSHNGAAISKEWAAPRCAWPRAPGRIGSKVHPADKNVNSTVPSADGTVVNGGAKCAWPRVRSKATVEVSANCVTGSHSLMSSSDETEGELAAGPRCAWPKSGTAGLMALEEKKQASPPPAKDFPRRMLTTSVGLSLMNFLLVAQGASALANPGDFLQDMGVATASGDQHVRNGRALTVR